MQLTITAQEVAEHMPQIAHEFGVLFHGDMEVTPQNVRKAFAADLPILELLMNRFDHRSHIHQELSLTQGWTPDKILQDTRTRKERADKDADRQRNEALTRFLVEVAEIERTRFDTHKAAEVQEPKDFDNYHLRRAQEIMKIISQARKIDLKKD